MPREAEPSLNEKAFVAQALQENLRLDNRAFDDYRPIELSFGDEYGAAEVKLGKTRYVAVNFTDYRYPGGAKASADTSWLPPPPGS